MKYVDYFLKLKCSSYVLSIVNPISAGPAKEISEAVTIIKRLREETLKEPMKYNVLELCAGNPLPSILSVFCQPVDYAVAVDKRIIERKWEEVRRFKYLKMDIYNDDIFSLINDNTIMISSHCCSSLAKRIIDIYNNSVARSLYMIPCCIGKMIPADFPQKEFLKEEIGKYKTWAVYLSMLCNGKLDQDNYCLSPANVLIRAKKYE